MVLMSDLQGFAAFKNISEDDLNTLLAAVGFSATVLFFGSGQLYYFNILEYTFSFADVALGLAVLAVVAGAALGALLLLLGRFMHTTIPLAIILALAALAWLQGNIMLWDYGILDGRAIQWSTHTSKAIIDTGVWATVLGLALWKHKVFARHARKVLALLIVFQAVSLVLLAFRTPAPDLKGLIEDNEHKFTFSRTKNVIIIILDTFQTDIFRDIVWNEPRFAKIFDGFTYFPDATGGYATTYPSVPFLLTGQYYQNDIPIQEFIKNAYLDDSLPLVLKRNGYDTNLPMTKFIYADQRVASNFVPKRSMRKFKMENVLSIAQVAGFRHMPHYLKMAVYEEMHTIGSRNRSGSIKHKDLLFLDTFNKKAKLGLDRPVFRYYHLLGLHRPFRLDAKFNDVKRPQTIVNARKHARAELLIVEAMLNKLKSFGIYDNSLVFILGDHGDMLPESPSLTSQGNMAYLVPLMLAKPFNSKGTLKVSKLPVMLADVPITVFETLGLEADSPGISLFGAGQQKRTDRRFYSYDWWGDKDKWEGDYLPALFEYEIHGFSWDVNSWKQTKSILTPEGVRVMPADGKNSRPIYNLGTTLIFGRWTYGKYFIGNGWDRPYVDFVASNARESTISLPIKPLKVTSKATLSFMVSLNNSSVKGYNGRIRVSLNGRKQTELKMVNGRYTWVTLPVLVGPQDGDELVVGFMATDADGSASDAEIKLKNLKLALN